MTRTTLAVDPVACAAYGYCAELLPELVALDEWGYPILRGTQVPPQLLELARRVAASCPRRAVHVRTAREDPASP